MLRSATHYKFSKDFLGNLLNKIQTEKKFSILAGDFNVNLIKYLKKLEINQFIEIIVSHNFISKITLLTRVTGRTASLIRLRIIATANRAWRKVSRNS